MQLRPHHLLCTQGYQGKGYDDAFVENMSKLVHQLRTETSTPITLTFSTDDLCAHCPNMCEVNVCKDNEQVLQMDRQVIEYFHLEEQTYIYQDLIQNINQQMTPEMLDTICKTCSWYPVSACKKNILGL